ncbi:MAG: hypothetical protein LQ350_000060 [Teloschistes chrysophthalmus]|nr:MAG: hypothetical protein LQ350_000060 [Niorma chrysophthalma]
MASIDDLFKKPGAPSNKRKFEYTHDPKAVYKATKVDTNGKFKSNGTATVEDVPEDDDMEAGPALPPDEPDEIIDDEEGRFFGGGITSDTADVLDFIDKQDEGHDEKPEKIDAAWLRKLALNFERRISKNSELRAKFEDDPQKFMGSEADLDADIKALSILSEHPDLYGEFARLGCVASLVSLLSHENTDIAIDAIEVIIELTDEDVEAEQEQWDAVVDAMLEADLLSLLFDNITRLDETNESDRAGLYHILSVLENLTSRSAISESVGKDTALIPWLLKRIQHKEPTVSQNKQYSAEILAILLQSSSLNRTKLIEADGVDILLQLLSSYRKRDPAKSTEEEEYVENLFDCVTCCVDEPAGKTKLLEAEGIELCLIMLREGKMSKPRALRLLDHALGGTTGAACCEQLVEAAGLKTIFSILMKKHDNQTTAHLLGILSSLLRSLPADSPPRIRLLAKFIEKDYEKIARTVHIRHDCAARVRAMDREIEREKKGGKEREGRADEWLSRRLDAGLYSLQTADVVLAWLVAEDTGARGRVGVLLGERGEGLGVLRGTLMGRSFFLLGGIVRGIMADGVTEQLDSMDPAPVVAGEEDREMVRDMLATLIEHLR